MDRNLRPIVAAWRCQLQALLNSHPEREVSYFANSCVALSAFLPLMLLRCYQQPDGATMLSVVPSAAQAEVLAHFRLPR